MTIDVEATRDPLAVETARRKRVFLIYLGLLLVPLLAGAFVLAKAPEETEIVAQKVAPVVERSVSSRVAVQVAREATPMIRENVSREVAMSVEPRLQSVAATTGELRGTLAGLGGEVERLKSNVAAVATNAEMLSTLRQRVDRVDRQQAELVRNAQMPDRLATEIASLRELVQTNAENQAADVRGLKGAIARIETRLTKLERRDDATVRPVP